MAVGFWEILGGCEHRVLCKKAGNGGCDTVKSGEVNNASAFGLAVSGARVIEVFGIYFE